MRGVLWMVLLAGGAFAAYTIYNKMHSQQGGGSTGPDKKRFVPKTPLIAGSRMTGRVAQTNTGRPPGFGMETSAYNPKFWAEVVLPSSQKSWVEVAQA